MEIQMAPELRIQQALGIQQAWDFSGHGSSAGMGILWAWQFRGHGNSAAGMGFQQQGPKTHGSSGQLLLSLRATIIHCMLQELLAFIN